MTTGILDELVETLPLRPYKGGKPYQPRPPRDPNQPQALVLITVQTTCTNCGRVWRTPNSSALVRYEINLHGVKYSKADCHPFLTLPREHRTHLAAPYCEQCF
jgi:hypothetical protein